MVIPYKKVRKDKRLAPSPLYFLKGDEGFLINDVYRRLVRQFLDPAVRDFNLVRISCQKDTSLSYIITQSEELPAASPKKILYLRNVGAMEAESLRGLAGYLQDTPPTTVIILSQLLKKGDARAQEKPALAALEEIVRKRGTLVQCSLSPEDVELYLEETWKTFHRFYAKRDLEIRSDAMKELILRAGDDLQHLVNEAWKLGFYAGDRKVITRKDVEVMVAPTLTMKTSKLTDSLGMKDARQALEVLDLLLEDGQNEQAILNYVNSFLKGTAELKGLRAEGLTPTEISQKLKKPDWAVRKGLAAAAKFSARDLRRAFKLLYRADIAMKSGKAPRLILELLMLELCKSTGRGG